VSDADAGRLEAGMRELLREAVGLHQAPHVRIAIASYLGSGPRFEDAIADFAEAYADQNERDHRALVEAVEQGRVEAVSA
jgi:uncharacterized protein DUF2252